MAILVYKKCLCIELNYSYADVSFVPVSHVLLYEIESDVLSLMTASQ